MAERFFTPAADLPGLESASGSSAGPDVLLLGDSISIGYTPHVRRLLAGIINVHRPAENCGDTRRGLEALDGWVAGRLWRVIHFNWGLWDLCHRHPDADTPGHRDKRRGRISVPLEEYGDNLDRLVARLRATGAGLVWASTTRVPPGEAGRFSEDVGRYNTVAAEVMRRRGVPINDLHATSLSLDLAHWAGADDVHCTPEGYRILAAAVAGAVMARVRVGTG